MTFEEMVRLAEERKQNMPKESSTTKLFEKGVHGIGKKLVEEAAESWMAGKYETDEELSLELSQVLYYVACMMAERKISLNEVYKQL